MAASKTNDFKQTCQISNSPWGISFWQGRTRITHCPSKAQAVRVCPLKVDKVLDGQKHRVSRPPLHHKGFSGLLDDLVVALAHVLFGRESHCPFARKKGQKPWFAHALEA
jgi:hypothetical protein